MLVRPSQEERVVAGQAMIACQRIRPHQLIDEAKVRCGIWVNDRGGDVELTHLSPSSRCRLPRPSARLGVEVSRNAPGASPASHVSRSTRSSSPRLRGKNPRKVNWLVGSPELIRAASTADGPGIGTTA